MKRLIHSFPLLNYLPTVENVSTLNGDAYLESNPMFFTKKTAIDPILGLSNELLCIPKAQRAVKLEVKVGSLKSLKFWV